MASSSVFDTLVEHALRELANRPATLHSLHRPARSAGDTAFHRQFVIARLHGDVPGLAHAKTQTAAPLTTTQRELLAAVGVKADTDLPHTLAIINAICNRQLNTYLPQLETAPETVMFFDAPQRVGMVGYFAPLVPLLTRAGHSVHCLEQDSQFWQSSQNVTVGPEHSALHHCDTVLCTATALLNNTLTAVRDAATHCTRFVLLGPSTPLAPQWLAKYGVTHLAGRHITNIDSFWTACNSGTDWSKHTRKFLLDIKKAPSPRGEGAL